MGYLVKRVTAVLVLLGASWGIAHGPAKRRTVGDESSDEFELAAYLGGASWTSTAASFRSGVVRVACGGVDLDLRGATLDPAGATLRVRTVFGGSQLLVPEDWQVTTRVVGIGGAGDGRPRIDRAPDAPRLTIEGTAFFGGLGVTSDIPEQAVRSVREAVAKRARITNGGPGVPVMEAETVSV